MLENVLDPYGRFSKGRKDVENSATSESCMESSKYCGDMKRKDIS